VRPETLLGEITNSVWTVLRYDCGTTVHLDDGPLGVLEIRQFTDELHDLYVVTTHFFPPEGIVLWSRPSSAAALFLPIAGQES
jgi:hypothetical protein